MERGAGQAFHIDGGGVIGKIQCLLLIISQTCVEFNWSRTLLIRGRCKSKRIEQDRYQTNVTSTNQVPAGILSCCLKSLTSHLHNDLHRGLDY